MNRAILEQGWHGFETVLAYKLEERGGYLCKVDPRHTSQTCSACGAVDRESRESQASFRCRQCGLRAHADHNGAINILRRNTAAMIVEEGQWLSVEAITIAGASRPRKSPAFKRGSDTVGESQLSPKNYTANIAACSRRSRSMVRPGGSTTSA
ncbi:zinc ribbon domain-containing protein [Rhizobium mongolense]|uniref:zinc ribbon domain-containing protein n=1 Tax=Rhizobium mongolense TaxID=57676 RepID=UPI000B812017